MPNFHLNALTKFIDWYHKVPLIKKAYLILILQAFGLGFLLKHYETQITTINHNHNYRIDSLTFFYTRQLSNCNSEKTQEYQNIVKTLQTSLEAQQKLLIETERLKIETEKLKQKK